MTRLSDLEERTFIRKDLMAGSYGTSWPRPWVELKLGAGKTRLDDIEIIISIMASFKGDLEYQTRRYQGKLT